MQKPEKLTFSFLLKLTMLSLLLCAGVIVKKSSSNQAIVTTQAITPSAPTPPTVVAEIDSVQSGEPYQKLVINKSENVVSI